MRVNCIVTVACSVCVAACLIGCETPEPERIKGSGQVEATEVMVGAKTAGEILTVAVAEGQQIEKDQLIATINIDKQQVQLEQAQAGLQEAEFGISSASSMLEQGAVQLDIAKKVFNRISALLSQGSATQQQYDDAEAKFKVARNQLEAGRSQLEGAKAKKNQLLDTIRLIHMQIDDGAIKSPITGVVVEKYVEAGELAAPGRTLVKVADLSRVWVKVYLSERDLAAVSLNQQAAVEIDGLPNQRFSGVVTWVSSQAEFTPRNVETSEARAMLVYAVKVHIANPEGIFKIGMPVTVILGQRPHANQ